MLVAAVDSVRLTKTTGCMVRDPTVWTLTWIEALIQAPLAYTIFVAYLRGWAVRKPLEILLASCHITGTLVFMVPELYKG